MLKYYSYTMNEPSKCPSNKMTCLLFYRWALSVHKNKQTFRKNIKLYQLMEWLIISNYF